MLVFVIIKPGNLTPPCGIVAVYTDRTEAYERIKKEQKNHGGYYQLISTYLEGEL